MSFSAGCAATRILVQRQGHTIANSDAKRPWPSRSLAFGARSHQPERNDDDDRTEPCANFRTPKEIALIPAHHVKSSPKEHENDYREATSDRGECNAIECVSN